MIKTNSDTYNRINSIIKDYIENDRFSTEKEYADLEESLMYAFSEKNILKTSCFNCIIRWKIN